MSDTEVLVNFETGWWRVRVRERKGATDKMSHTTAVGLLV